MKSHGKMLWEGHYKVGEIRLEQTDKINICDESIIIKAALSSGKSAITFATE